MSTMNGWNNERNPGISLAGNFNSTRFFGDIKTNDKLTTTSN